MTVTDLIALTGFLAVCCVVASSGAYFRPGQWYRDLSKPSWTPPNWLFPLAWTALYIMIAVAGWLVWRAAGFDGGRYALIAYGLHLVFNGFWSGLFFGARRVDLAFVDVILMWLTLAATIVLFLPISPLAASLLIPYLAWVSFAAVLNLAILRRNPVMA